MKHIFLKGFTEGLESLPASIKKKFFKQLRFLIQDIGHPSLRAKKYDERRGTWQARVDRNYRFYFLIERDTYVLLAIRRHTKK